MFTFPFHHNYIESADLLLKLIGSIGALVLFIVGYRRYIKDQTWKRHEFLANEIKEFTANKMVRNIMYMLDWKIRYIELFPDKPNYDERFVKVDRQIFKMALQYDGFRTANKENDKFSRTEVAIRDNLDQFLSYLERFDQYVKAGLISIDEIKPYLEYWILKIADGLEQDVKNFMCHYINQYHFEGTQRIFDKFNKDIRPETNLETTNVSS